MAYGRRPDDESRHMVSQRQLSTLPPARVKRVVHPLNLAGLRAFL
jgi:hypothetical protein